jgi:hypothetical protein
MQRLLSLALAGLAACGGERPSPEADATATPEVREVHFTATDFAFDGPETIEAGMVTLVFNNEGETWHHLQLVKLPEGMSVDELQASFAEIPLGSPLPSWYQDVGGVNPPPPGEPARATLMIEPGEYAVLCVVDTPDKVPHIMKGMISPLTVTPSSEPAAPLPEADLSLTLVDYAFGFSSPPTAGTQVIRVENGANQSHEIALFRFLPGKTMDDLMAWAESYEGPAPIEAAGGVPGIRPGQAVNIEVTLSPGDYVALCFLPDATDGMPHIVHGMALPFQIS